MNEEQGFTLDELGPGDAVKSEQEDRGFTLDELGPGETMSSSALGAAARRGVQEVPSATAAGVAGVAAAGLAEIPGAALAPFTAGTSAVALPLAAGIPAAIYVGGKAHDVQEWLLDKAGLREGTGFFSRNQEEVDRAQHPYATFGGELAAALPTFGTGLTRTVAGKISSTVPALGRGVGAGIQGGMEAGREVWQGEDLDPTRIGMATAAGALLAKPRGWVPGGGGVFGKNEQPQQGQEPQPQVPAVRPGTPEEARGNPNRATPPDQINLGRDADVPMEGEVIPPQQSLRESTPNEREVQFAAEQRDLFETGDPMWNFWNEHVMELQNRPAQQKGFAGTDDEARWGPSIEGDYTPVTPADLSRSNDVTTVASGVAAENPRTPEVRGAGNPVGAPMSARIAARPSEPTRDYRKSSNPDEQQGRAGTTSGDITPDVARAMSDSELDQAIGPSGQEPRRPPLSGMDPVEASQLTREAEQRALAATRERMASEQKGEAFEGIDVQPEHVTATVTPAEQARIEELKGQFKTMPQVMERVNALPPKVQLQALEVIRKKLDEYQAQETKAAYDVGARPKTATGMTARSKSDLARKQGVLDAYETAAKEYGTPAGNEQQGQTMSRLTKLVQRANELTGGQAYRPNVKPPAYQLVQAAKKVLSRPSAANLEAYKKAELALVEGDKALAETNQAEKRIEADIEKRPGVSDVVAERILNRENEGSTNRIEHETFDNSLGDESAVYKEHHDGLTNFLNGLSDKNWHLLNEVHEGKLDSMVRTTQDPRELRHTLLQDLAESQRKNPPRLEFPAEDGPVVKRTSVKSASDVAASEGRRIDPNSAEGKAIAAAALARMPKRSPKLEDVQQAERRAYGADLPKDTEAPPKPAIDGSTQSLAEHWAKMLADEGGAVNPNAIVRDLSDWMKTAGKAVTNIWHPQVPQSILDYGAQIGFAGVKLNTQLTRIKQQVLAAARAAVHPDGSVPVPAEFANMYRAYEDKDLGRLSAKDKQYWDTHVKPLLDKVHDTYRDLRDLTIANKLPGWDTMPEQIDNGKGYKNYMPRRIRRGSEDDDPTNPMLNRSLSNWAASGQERDWFALQDSNGTRRIYRINENGNMVFYQNHKAGRAQTPPAGFNPAQVGSDLAQAGGRKWKVDNATVDELQAHGNGEGGKPLRYVDNPIIAAADALVGLRSALARARLLENVLSDPQFSQLNARSRKDAEARWGAGNVTTTDLPQLAGRYMPKALAWAFDDLVKQGWHYGDDSALASLARVSQTLLKPFYIMGPEVHVFNELDKFIAASPILKGQLPKLPQHIREAFQSVKNQDAIQAEIMDAGGNPMYGHAAVARLWPQIGKLVGEDMSIRPFKYDPLMKLFGTNTRDVFDQVYQMSNKVMWWQSDVLYTAMYKAFKAQGLNPRQAVHEAEKIIDSYVVPTTFGKTLGLGAEYGGLRADIGRQIQKFLTDPITANFGRFSYGLAKTAANVVKNVAGPNSSASTRAAGAAQLAMLFVGMPLVYHGLSKMYGMITGNENSEFEQRGVTRMVNTPFAIYKGDKDAHAISQRIWSPSVPIDTALRLYDNRDFAGRKIWDTPGHFVEFMAGQTVSPLRSLSAGIEQGGAGFGAQRFLESNFGLKTPSAAATKYQQLGPKRAAQEHRRNINKPRGTIDRGINWLVN